MNIPLPGQRMLSAHALDAPVVAVATRTAGRQGVELAAVRVKSGAPGPVFASPPEPLVDFNAYAGDAPIVGFGLVETLTTLTRHGAAPAGSPWDVEELAAYVAPDAQEPTPLGMARVLLGPDGLPPARAGGPLGATEEAGLVGQIYLALVERAGQLPSSVLVRLAQLVEQARSPLSDLLNAVATDSVPSVGGSMLGMDLLELQERLGRQRPIGAPTAVRKTDPGEVDDLLGPNGPFAKEFPRYEPRPEQLAMAHAVADVLATPADEGPKHLLVEGGTGIGKSVAYLLPAVLFALRNNVRVVVSTNTINLQEQLITKDIPDILTTLEGLPGLDTSRLQYGQMKGKANYLCLRRWQATATAGSLTADEARLIAKTLVWLQTSKTGDLGELKLSSPERLAWERLSASGFASCTGAREGACFYRHARDNAIGSHLVVVNHALLLSDLLVEGSLLPDYDFLIVDEAHNLEAEATRQFGFRVGQATIEDLLDRGSSELQSLNAAITSGSLGELRKDSVRSLVGEALVPLYGARDCWSDLVAAMTDFTKMQRSEGEEGSEVRLTPAMRSASAWSDLEIKWDKFDQSLSETAERVGALLRDVDTLLADGVPGLETLKGALSEWTTVQQETRSRVAGFVARPDSAMVYWISGLNALVSLNGAPLDVSLELGDRLFSQKQAVVLTSATLTVGGDFAHMRSRIGLEDPTELTLGSPFDYQRAALLCLPNDVPEPRDPLYVDVVADTLRDLAIEAQGRTMALFTSHASLRATALALRRRLARRNIDVLAQGVDGTPQQLVARFQQQPKAVLLGTASFWEGVDIGNDSLKVLVLARLPFNVPTEPVFAARADLYEQAFLQYAIPQAVLRFRQGFGRLIRSKNDKGAVIVLDGRMTSKGYGAWFTRSLPPATIFRGTLTDAVNEVGVWLRSADS